MKWDTVQQFVRIALYTGGSFFFGSEIADGQLYQGLIGGAVAVGAFLWWLAWESKRPA